MNSEPVKSPMIERHSWGSMDVEGIGHGKDFKLWPGGGREWDWSETGTHHVPGIQPGDVSELLDHGCRFVVLSRGRLKRLQTCAETIKLLESKGVEVRVAETARAAGIYNRLAAEGRAVGGLFHSTC